MNKLLTIFCLLLFSSGILAQSPEFRERKHSYKQGNLQYRVLYPENFREDQKYPLVIFLHGAGERGDDNKKQLVHGSKLFLDAQNRKDFPAIVVFPQCPTEDYWANVTQWRDEENKRHFDFHSGGKPTNAMRGVLSLVDSLTKLNHVNTDKVYAMGLSMGGMGTFELVSRRPKVFAAATPICGGDNPKSARKYAGKVPFWIFHGQKDDIVLPKYSEVMVDAIKSRGGEVKFTLYPNANHNSWDPTFAEPELLPWLFSQTRN